MLVQEEARLKKPMIHSVNLMGHKRAGKKHEKKNGNDNHGQLKVKQSSAQSIEKDKLRISFVFATNLGTIRKIVQNV